MLFNDLVSALVRDINAVFDVQDDSNYRDSQSRYLELDDPTEVDFSQLASPVVSNLSGASLDFVHNEHFEIIYRDTRIRIIDVEATEYDCRYLYIEPM